MAEVNWSVPVGFWSFASAFYRARRFWGEVHATAPSPFSDLSERPSRTVPVLRLRVFRNQSRHPPNGDVSIFRFLFGLQTIVTRERTV
jgi:hypothetical protein